MTTRGKRSSSLTDEQKRSRKTALTVAAVFALLALWNVYRRRLLVVEIFGALSAVLLMVGLFLPSWAARFDRGWFRLAAVLGYINSRILLSIVYFLVITPFGLVMRLFRRDVLRRRKSGQATYWIPRQCPRQPRGAFERPF